MGHAGHTIHGTHHHFGWSRDEAPVLTIAPGETVAFDCLDASAGQVLPSSTETTIGALDFSRVNPVTGPVYVDGAKPGDTLKVTIASFSPSGFGWTANIPGFGLLADDFPEPGLHLWTYDATQQRPAMFGPAKVPVRPFAGTLGVAPVAPGVHSVVPPRNVGGNMDVRDLTAGTVLYLPVEVEGALFSAGDTHAAQGDGEVCGTAIESAMGAVFTIEIARERSVTAPQFVTPGPVTRHLDEKGYDVTTGIGPSLMDGARDAVRRMIERLSAHHGLRPMDAYMLCSVAGDLRISEIVDQPNWVVSFYFPRSVLD